MRASRERLAVAQDSDRRGIEREFHDGPQQHLVALAVNLQLARDLVDADPRAAKALLEDMGREVQLALEQAGKLAHRIYPPLLEAGGLAAALRAAAVMVGIPTRIEVEADVDYPPETAGAVYFSCVELLELDGVVEASINVRSGDGALVFEVAVTGLSSSPGLAGSGGYDRVEALGGQLVSRTEAPGEYRVVGSLPLRR